MNTDDFHSYSQTQIFKNRVILSKLNPIVRKNSKQTANTNTFPSEWNDQQVQSYRLLVGPRIKEYMNYSDNENVVDDEGPNLKEIEKEKKEKLLSKLVPSRLKTPISPLPVSKANIQQLNFPSDLFPYNIKNDIPVKSDILERSMQRSKTGYQQRRKAIIKPKKSKTPKKSIKPFSSDSYIETEPNENIDTVNEQQNADENPVIELPQSEPAEPELMLSPEINEEPTIENSKNEEQNSKEVKSDDRLEKNKLRSYFYALRCWSHYKINARVKAVFIVDVMNTSILIRLFKGWHVYVRKLKHLRLMKNEVRQNHQHFLISKCWDQWKESASKVIVDTKKAMKALNARNRRTQKIILNQYFQAAHGKRMCRRDIEKHFRYDSEIDGDDAKYFVPIENEYYRKKRRETILACHHYFVKNLPQYLNKWIKYVKLMKHDRQKTSMLDSYLVKVTFHKWYDTYRLWFHRRIMSDVLHKAADFQIRINDNEREAADHVEKIVMVQLLRDKQVLNAKLKQFDRLALNHVEAVQRRRDMRKQINDTTKNYFARQEELMLIDFNKQANESSSKVREVRYQLAESFMYHMGRAVRSYENQIVAKSFCFAFRVLTEPLVKNAVSYFYEKRYVKSLVRSAAKQSQSLKSIVQCTKLFMYGKSFGIWKKYINEANLRRSDGLMSVIRRRIQVLQLYPFFNFVEILPVRPPRPLKEVEQMFKDLPLVSIQRKVARERVHHVNVRMMLMRRRMLREFIRAYASYVQEQIAIREVMKLYKQRREVKTKAKAYMAFKLNADESAEITNLERVGKDIQWDIIAWHRHFFRARNHQAQLIQNIPVE